MWDAAENTGFGNDIFGIGRDDASALGQVQSQSVNTDGIITIFADAEGTNAVNAFTDIDDLEFLTISNDNDNDGTIAVVTTELDTNTYQDRLDREWKVDETGETGTVDLTANLVGLFDPMQSIYVLINGSDDFSGSVTSAIPATSWNGVTASFEGINLNDAEYFTFASEAQIPTPGGVVANLASWLKADASVFNDGNSTAVGTSVAAEGDLIGSWNDVSENGNYFYEGTKVKPTFRANQAELNYNPGVSLEAVDNGLLTDFSIDDRPFSFYTVYKYEGFTYRGQLFAADSGSVNWGVGAGGGQGSEGYNSAASGGVTYQTPQANQALNQARIGLSQTTTTESAFFLNGQDVTSNSNPGIAPGAIGFGAENTFNNAMQGDAAEAIFFDRILTSIERQKVDSYLALKYGVTLDQTIATDYIASTAVSNAGQTTVAAPDVPQSGGDVQLSTIASVNHDIEWVPLTDGANGITSVQIRIDNQSGGDLTVIVTATNTVTAVSYTHLTLPTNREV